MRFSAGLSRRSTLLGLVGAALPLRAQGQTSETGPSTARAFLITDFGAVSARKKEAPPDSTDAIRRAIEAAKQAGGGVVSVPSGRFAARNITLAMNVSLVGMAERASEILALPDPTARGFITIEAGPVTHASVSNLTLTGGTPDRATNVGQWALMMKSEAAKTGKPHGGWWWSYVSQVEIQNFDKGIQLWGSEAQTDLLPHQWLSFRNVIVYLAAGAGGPSLEVRGQVNQVDYRQCHFDCRTAWSSLRSGSCQAARDSGNRGCTNSIPQRSSILILPSISPTPRS